MLSSLHPATRILCWVAFAFLAQFLDAPQLVLTGTLAAILLSRGLWPSFWSMLLRARWLLLSLTLIYGWATPGESWLNLAYAPSVDGLQAGLMQAGRLALMLAALALLLGHTDRNELLAGIYCLMRPCARLGWSAERAAVRIWLTLHYAETAPAGGTLAQRLQSAFAMPVPVADMALEIECRTFTWRDGAAGVALMACMAALLP
jgi:energy-coupling factor transport system permease protein